MRLPRVWILLAGGWGSLVSTLLLASALANSSDVGAYLLVVESLSLSFYCVLVVISAGVEHRSRLMRFGLLLVAVLLALAGGLAGPIFYSVSIIALLMSALRPRVGGRAEVA